MKYILGIICLAFITIMPIGAQVQTITVNTNASISNGLYTGAVLVVPTNSFAICKSFVGGGALLQINAQGSSVQLGNNNISLSAYPIVVAGPASIQIQQQTSGAASAFATFDVEPGPFPPGKAVTVGAYSGNVQVTMEMSTDLVNWVAATNGIVYTNSPDARFFRIKLVTNASP